MLPLLIACAEPAKNDPGAASVEGLEVVVPSAGLPAEVVPQESNNNLDVAEHDGRVFLAFRTAPSHFASPDTTLYVVSSIDEVEWTFEASFQMGTDLREPRFLAWDGSLFLYFAELGDNPADFEPRGAWRTQRQAEGQWTDPAPLYPEAPGFIPWRAKVVDGTPYLIGYTGGENIYDIDGEPIAVHLLTTADGHAWEPVVPGQPVVDEGGGSETDFVIQDDGSLIAVERDEAGSDTGWGSRICRAEAGDWGSWTCVGDPRKYDSPLLFRDGDDVWLIGRRNVTETGAYDLGMDDLSPEEQTLQYELAYWQQPKRCSLWKVDPDALSVAFVLDLPSKGDTCFASALPRGAGSWRVYNYSSPVDGEDVSWFEGQNGETYIYRMDLRLP